METDEDIRRLELAGTSGKIAAAAIRNPSSVLAAGTQVGPTRFVLGRSYGNANDEGTEASDPDSPGLGDLIAARGRRHPRECEMHGWMQDRADPDARARAVTIAREDAPPGVSLDEAVAEILNVLDSIGDTCPECLPGE